MMLAKDSRSEDHSTLRKCHVWQLASARLTIFAHLPSLPIPRKLSEEIAEGQRGAADLHSRRVDAWQSLRQKLDALFGKVQLLQV
jgi:hypothetical protein